MRTNTTKAKLQAGETVYGCFLRYPDATLVEAASYHGWDFLVFDGEHGIIEPRDCENMARAAELREVTPIVRVPTNSPPIILRFMDTGAQGLHIPWVNSGAEAEAAVRSVKYHPRGIRGLAGVRASDFGQGPPFKEYVRQANAETLVIVHIETREAVERVEEIVAIDGVDVVFIGPTDLSHSYGVPGEPQHPDVQAAFERIIEAVSQTDKALGIMVRDVQGAQAWSKRGARYITIVLESVLTPAARSYLKTAREE